MSDYRYIPFSDSELKIISHGIKISNGRTNDYFMTESLGQLEKMAINMVSDIDAEIEIRNERRIMDADRLRKEREIRCGCCNHVTGYKP